ncbi:hypothetical protein MHLP_01520 [Candidatus Mycoplasma haematolamae str. Purdue]|uniref:Uncharacterized protein n=1 Tax=Mycoplasma haematolamae (strain Purdue) TaxID=1212765 RepID=I7CJ33_MYCHA|nr:hypothetical protein [Candidatus Mycoplasma haematolamae]AFO51884.1 hypothetical protein MHLP_01520 [Candidatus Mycoplasma haematolamae str. Purdue]
MIGSPLLKKTALGVLGLFVGGFIIYPFLPLNKQGGAKEFKFVQVTDEKGSNGRTWTGVCPENRYPSLDYRDGRSQKDDSIFVIDCKNNELVKLLWRESTHTKEYFECSLEDSKTIYQCYSPDAVNVIFADQLNNVGSSGEEIKYFIKDKASILSDRGEIISSQPK